MRRFAVITGFMVPFSLFAQGVTAPPTTTKTQLVVIVDGSKNPEQIPTDLAYRHFLLAVAAHEQPTADEQKRQHAFLGAVGLLDADEKAIALELGKMTTQLEAIQEARGDSDGTPAALAAFKAQEDALISATIARVRQVVSVDGLSHLDGYITETVKRNIKIYGLPT